MTEQLKIEVPIWHRVNLTIPEAAAYTGVGINKIRELVNEKDCNFVLKVGKKNLIKRTMIEKYLLSHEVI